MNARRMLAAAGLAVLLAGCDKKVNITFVNQTLESRDVYVASPYSGQIALGTLPPGGGVGSVQLKIKKDDLPCTFTWLAGDQQGELPVAKKTPKNLRIDLTVNGPTAPYKWKGKVKNGQFIAENGDDDDD